MATGIAVVASVVLAAGCSSSARVAPSTSVSSTTSSANTTAPTTPLASSSTSEAPSSSTPPSGPPTTEAAGAPSVLDAVHAEIADDGSIPLDVARQLFQLSYGGLQGVTLPTGAASTGIDGTEALAAMDSHRSELSPADRRALDGVIDPGGAVSTIVTPADVGAAGGATTTTTTATTTTTTTTTTTAPARVFRPATSPCPDSDPAVSFGTPRPASDVDVGDFRLRVEHWLEVLGLDVGTPLGFPVEIVVYPADGPKVEGVTAAADTWTFDDNCGGDAPSACRIRFFKGAIDAGNEQRDADVVHELWHCFEVAIVGTRTAAYGESNWIIEGEATWVAAKATGFEDPEFRIYLKSSGANLFKRSYSAIGFYTTMESDGANMFPALQVMLGAGTVSNTQAFHAALNAAPGLLDNWASMFFEDPSNDNWHYSKPTGDPPPYSPGANIPDASDVDVDNGSTIPVSVEPHTVQLVRIHPKSDFVHVTASGHASTLDEGNTETKSVTDTWFCVHDDPSRCQCPDGQSGNPPDSTSANGEIRFAQAAGDDAEQGEITGASIDSFCKPDDVKNSAFCMDAKSLHDITQAYVDSGAADIASQAQADELWTGKMSADAPGDIAAAMAPVADAFASMNQTLASVGYQTVGGPDVIQAGQKAIATIAAVKAQAAQVGEYIGTHCGFQFTFV